MSDAGNGSADERWRIGAELIADVYQGMVPAIQPGLVEFSDIMVRDLFGGVWTREQLGIGQRRLIVMGVVAAIGGPDTWKLQCKSALKRGELTEEQVREVLIQATPYVGYPRAAELLGATEEAINECRSEAAAAAAAAADEADSETGDGTG